ncbi:MAG: class 1 fructose-bisphosphatase [Nitrospiraceae bacterium]
MIRFPLTLTRHILEQQAAHPGAKGEFSLLMAQIGLVGKLITNTLRRAGLINILGLSGETNVQGEAVKKLDSLANETFIKVFETNGLVSALASEEEEKALMIPEAWTQAKYMLLFDPLDGSSNTDVNMPLGTIFSILRHHDPRQPPKEADLIRCGREQVAAGYLLYGSSTMLVFTTGQGVHGFTLDPQIGEYVLSHESIKMPSRGSIYSVNEGNYRKWPAGMQRYIDQLKVKDKAKGRPYTGRYSGCLVGDVHRVLLAGGIFLYPAEVEKPDGKLRLLYEANPLAMVVEQAGGFASTGIHRILDIEPSKLHQRVPLLIGSREDVLEAEAAVKGTA